MATPLPGLDVLVVDPQTGQMMQPWYDYFQSQVAAGGTGGGAANTIFALASEYDVVGDNVTDDTEALQAMIDDVSANDKIGVLVGTDGTIFKTTSALVAPSSTMLKGIGRWRSIIKPTGAVEGIVAAGNTSPSTRTFYWDLRDFTIEYPSGSGGIAFNLQNVSHAFLSINAIYANVGIWCSEACFYNHVEQSAIANCDYGMFMQYASSIGSNSNTFISVHVQGIPPGGFGVVDYSNQNTWIGCSFEGDNASKAGRNGARFQSGSAGSSIISSRFEGLDEGIRVAAGAVRIAPIFNYYENCNSNLIDGGTSTYAEGQT